MQVDVRCPRNYGRLFAKFLVPGTKLVIVEGNLIEFACRDCRRELQSDYNNQLAAVLHRFDITGDLRETELIFVDSRQSTLLRVDPNTVTAGTVNSRSGTRD